MSDVYQSLAHSKWDCKYQVVFKRRRKAIFGNIRRQLGPIFHALAKQKECQIVEGHLMTGEAAISTFAHHGCVELANITKEMSLAIGTVLGPYEIAAPIGAGGMGELYTARDQRLEPMRGSDPVWRTGHTPRLQTTAPWQPRVAAATALSRSIKRGFRCRVAGPPALAHLFSYG